jgi:ABC-type uncharacterized transport system substrate-binding protein
MALARAFFTSALLLLSGTAMVAGTPDDLLKSLKKQWPDKKQGIVICNTQVNADTVQALAAAAEKTGISLQVFNVATDRDIDSASGIVMQSRPDFVVLVDQDPVLGASGKQTKKFIQRASSAGVPTISTGESLMKIGAVLSPEGTKKS